MSRKSAKKFSVIPVGKGMSEINVTPLVDIVLVLLIIFMVVTPLLEKDIEVKVPEAEQLEEEFEVPPDQLVVGLTASGEITVNMEKIPTEEYVEKLKRVLAAKAEGSKIVFFMADEASNYGRVVAALDGARQAGAEVLGMMTNPPDKIAADPLAPPPPAE